MKQGEEERERGRGREPEEGEWEGEWRGHRETQTERSTDRQTDRQTLSCERHSLRLSETLRQIVESDVPQNVCNIFVFCLTDDI